MKKLIGKIQLYANARAQGLEPKLAGAQAGYALPGLAVTVCRLEKREDVRAEITRLRRGGKRKSATAKDIEHALGVSDKDDMEKWALQDNYATPLDLMRDVMNNPKAPRSLRYQAAKDALPYCHARKEGGKKDADAEAAREVAGKGRFQTGRKPGRANLRAVS